MAHEYNPQEGNPSVPSVLQKKTIKEDNPPIFGFRRGDLQTKKSIRKGARVHRDVSPLMEYREGIDTLDPAICLQESVRWLQKLNKEKDAARETRFIYGEMAYETARKAYLYEKEKSPGIYRSGFFEACLQKAKAVTSFILLNEARVFEAITRNRIRAHTHTQLCTKLIELIFDAVNFKYAFAPPNDVIPQEKNTSNKAAAQDVKPKRYDDHLTEMVSEFKRLINHISKSTSPDSQRLWKNLKDIINTTKKNNLKNNPDRRYKIVLDQAVSILFKEIQELEKPLQIEERQPVEPEASLSGALTGALKGVSIFSAGGFDKRDAAAAETPQLMPEGLEDLVLEYLTPKI